MKQFISKVLLIIILLSISTYCFPQQYMDSLKTVFSETTDLAQKLEIHDEIKSFYNEISDDSINLRNGFELEQNLNNPEYNIKTLIYKSFIEQSLKQFDSSRASAEKAVNIANEINSKSLLAAAYLNKATLFENMGMYDAAYNDFNEAFHLYEEISDSSKLIFTLNHMGMIHAFTDDFKESERFFLKGLKIAEAYQRYQHIASTLSNLARIYIEMDLDQKAIEIEKKALKINLDNKLYAGIAYSYINISLIYSLQSQTDSVEKYLKLALQQAGSYESKVQKVNVLQRLSDFYLDINDTAKAEIYLYEAELTLNNSEIVSPEHYILALQAEIKRTFADLYNKKGNHKKEAEYYRDYKTLSDSLDKDRNYKEMTKIRFEYNYKKEKIELELKNQKGTYRFYLIILFLLFGITLSLLLFIQQKSKAKKAQIEKEKSFLKNENLKQKMELSDKLITSNTLIQLSKNEILNAVIEKLEKVKSKFAVSNHKIIDETIDDLKKSLAKNNWDKFLDQFEKVHESFFLNLIKISEHLTFNEKRLCALIRLKMSIKEIATMNHLSIRSVEMARYRLRKKLNLTGSDESIDDFLANL